jgi:hypothetical protein
VLQIYVLLRRKRRWRKTEHSGRDTGVFQCLKFLGALRCVKPWFADSKRNLFIFVK